MSNAVSFDIVLILKFTQASFASPLLGRYVCEAKAKIQLIAEKCQKGGGCVLIIVMETFLIFTVIVISAFIIFFINRKKINNQFSDPQRVLKSIEDNLSTNHLPQYIAIHNLKKSIELNPDHPELISKLRELETNNANSSPKTLYAVLSTLICLMGIMPIIFWNTGKINLYGLVISVVFILIAFVIYLQYLKEK